MAIMGPVLVEGAQLLARQAASTTASVVSSVLAATSSSIIASSTADAATSTTANSAATTTIAAATATSTDSNNSPSGSNSSPLLFFVALGFGVVFTNLWIIVGVKYCFRYNARSRQLRLNEDGEPINMDNIQRPHRRRREKKLMTMDEVNEKFPMTKYKTWVASRAHEGLPSRGGVSAPASRANSLRDEEGVIQELPSKERDSIEDAPAMSAVAKESSEASKLGHNSKESTSSAAPVQPTMATDANTNAPVPDDIHLAKAESHDEEDEEDEHINAALPPELVGTSGDTCAICIDALEDDDDVRGLTCGHAFHAVCLDPWLTSRRACCPLCKADYYTPKPRAPAAESNDGSTLPLTVAIARIDGNRGHGINMPSRPATSRLNLRATTRRILPTHNNDQQGNPQSPNSGSGRGFMSRFRQRPDGDNQTTNRSPENSNSEPSGGLISNIRSGLSGLVPSRRGPTASGANVTDSQLEAGVRTA